MPANFQSKEWNPQKILLLFVLFTDNFIVAFELKPNSA